MNRRVLLGIPITLLLTWSAAHPAIGQAYAAHTSAEHREGPAIERLARLDIQEVPLAAALSRLSDVSGVTIAFSPSVVEQERRLVSCACAGLTVGGALDHLLAGTGFGHSEFQGQVIVYRSPERAPMRSIESRPWYYRTAALGSPGAQAPRAPASVVRIQGTVTGRIIAADTGQPLGAVRVQVVGTNLGAITNPDGRFEIRNVPEGEVELQVQSLGFVSVTRTVTVPPGGSVSVDFQLARDVLALDGVVVTAFGIERAARSLSYSTQGVNTESMSQARDLNVVNSLQGKVAGLNINQASTGVGSSSRVVLRGNRSISGSNEPLIVLDGVPIRGSIGDINPDDIASIDVLKGPNGAALYGSAAQNGAIVITTHRGGPTDGVRFTFSQTYMQEDAILPDVYQNEYGQGTGGVYSPNSEFSWGPRMDGRMVDFWRFSDSDHMDGRQYPFLPQPNNVQDAFRTGHNLATNLTASVGGERSQAHVSYTFTDAAGMIPGNELSRHNISLSVRSQLVDRLTLDSRVTYMNQRIENQLATGENFTNPLRHIYRLPRNIRTEDLVEFEYFNRGHQNRQNYFNVGSNGGANPYWTLNRNLGDSSRDRALGILSLTYSLTDNLRLLGRSSYDAAMTSSETRLYNDTYVVAPFGRYLQSRGDSRQWNSDVLLTFSPNVGRDWTVDANLGGSVQERRNASLTSQTGSALIVRNFFTLSNSLNPQTSHSIGSPSDVHSVYSFAQVGWRQAVFLDVSGRNDWSSTLPADSRSYFYPSVGLAAVVTDLMPIAPEILPLAKLRASWARVGNDASPFSLTRGTTFTAGGNNGFLRLSPTLPALNLLPEQTESIELGADLGFIQNRVGLDFTWYRMSTTNQLFTLALPVGSGASSLFTNGGDVENRGFETLLTLIPVQAPRFGWELNTTFARNRNTVVAIHEALPSLQIASDFLRVYRIEEGRPFGQVYSRGLLRDDQGRVIVGTNGIPRVTGGQTVPVANFNPDWTAGLGSSIRYGNFNANFLVDHRQGGTMVSLRNAILYADGLTTATLQGREGGLIFGQNFFEHETAVLQDGSPNNIPVSAENFWRAVGGRNAPVGELFVESATNTRLREMTVGYTFSQRTLESLRVSGLSGLSVSLVGRNLFFLNREAANLDPDLLVGTGSSAEGFESFTMPTARTFGVNVRGSF
jgi:TonB-linked SusC/RagA family outer membrane protein